MGRSHCGRQVHQGRVHAEERLATRQQRRRLTQVFGFDGHEQARVGFRYELSVLPQFRATAEKQDFYSRIMLVQSLEQLPVVFKRPALQRQIFRAPAADVNPEAGEVFQFVREDKILRPARVGFR